MAMTKADYKAALAKSESEKAMLREDIAALRAKIAAMKAILAS